MKIQTYKNIEFSEIKLSELGQEMRFDADYWEPAFLRNEEIIKAKKHSLIKRIAPNPQYGISISMNEDGNGYTILKMDNIMNLLAEDIDTKFAQVSKKAFELFHLKKFDVLFNRVNSDEFVGRTGIFLLEGKPIFASYLVRLDSGKSFTNCYITAYLNCKYGKTALQRVKRRAVNQANINAKELGNLNLPAPTESLQKEIEILLLKAQELKNKSEGFYSEAKNLLLGELGLISWKPRTVTFKFQKQKVDVEDTVNIISSFSALNFDRIDSEYWLPKYEEMFSIIEQNALSIQSLQGLILYNQRGVQPTYVSNGDIAVINSRHIGEKHIDYENLERTSKSLFDLPKSKSAQVRKHDILIYTTGAYVGRTNCYLKDTPALASNHVNILRVSKYPIYVSFVLNSIIGEFQTRKNVKGSAQVELYPFEIKRFYIPFIQEKFIKRVEKLYSDSLSATEASNLHLEIAKRSVEIFIEQNEKAALNFIKSQKR